MTRLPAERVRIRVLVRLETPEGREHEQQESARRHQRNGRLVTWIVQVDHRKVLFDGGADPLAAMLPPDAEPRDRQSPEEKRRKDDERDDAHVGLGRLGELLEQEQEQDEAETHTRDHRAGECRQVVE